MMRELTRSIGDAVFENLGRATGRVQENTPLAADVLESDDDYLVVFDAPGVTASDVQVQYVDDRIEVRVDRFREFYDGFEMLFPGRGLSLDGSVQLPDDAVVDAADATATLTDHGTLDIRVPKAHDGSSHLGDHADEQVADTVEEADEREDAGTPVGDESATADDERTDDA